MCEVSPRLTRLILFVTAIFALLSVLPLISATIICFTDKFIKYTGLQLLMGIMTAIVLADLLAGGIIGIIGIKKQNLKCVLALFFMMILSLFILLGLAIFSESIQYSYGPKQDLTLCTERYEKQPDLVYLGLADTQNIVCSAFCPCKYDLNATLASQLGGVNMDTGATKLQECGDPWNSKLEKAANIMAYLEQTYKCRGFCADPTYEHFSYSNTNKQSIGFQCQGYFEKYVEQITYTLAGTYFGVALAILLMLLVHCFLFSTNVVTQQQLLKMKHNPNDETVSRLKN